MVEDQFGHFKHADTVFAIENLAKFIVGFDERFVLRVLKIVAANVIPQFLCDFGAGKGLAPDNFAKFLVRLNRLQKCRTRLPFGLGLCFGHNPAKAKGAAETGEMG